MMRRALFTVMAAAAFALPAAAAEAKRPVPVSTSPPTLSGNAVQGTTLTGSNGTWGNNPTAYADQWQRCDVSGASCVAIAGATSLTYTLAQADVGSTVRLLVTATNAGGSSSATSAPTAVVVPLPPASTAAPTIAGSAVLAATLTASAGTWANNPTTYAYGWQRCDASGASCAAISGATASSYRVAVPDLGHTLRVAVVAGNAGGSSSPATSTPTAVVAAPPAGIAATAYQLNAAHTGTTSDTFSAGAVRQWSVNLGSPASYPLIVGNQVFVTAGGSNTSSATSLYALDATTGAIEWGPVALGGAYWWSGLTYDGGRVFTVNGSGQMQAFDAATGALGWTIQLPAQSSFSSAPTASNGIVYTGGAGSGGTVYAVDEATGSVLWTAAVMNGDDSSPAVSSSGVYVSYACGQTYDFDPSSGKLLWHRATTCSGGGGKTPVLANGRLYVRDSQFPGVLDAAAGNLLAPFAASGPAPAVTTTTVFDLQNGTLTATGTTPGSSTNWSFSGDGTLSSAPLVAGDAVIVAGTSGAVYALSASTGSVLWSASAGSGVAAPDEQNVSHPLTGLAASGGLLVVPAGTGLVAFR
jgi:outer membrane protein assembly factor BamB